MKSTVEIDLIRGQRMESAAEKRLTEGGPTDIYEHKCIIF